MAVNIICFPIGEVRSENSYPVMEKTSQKYFSKKITDKFINKFGYNKSVNWLYFDAAVNNLNSKKHVS